MAHLVFAWELGAGFGHLAAIAALGSALSRRGHRVTAAVPALSGGRRLLEPLGIAVVDAPDRPAPARSAPISLNYTANLLRNGYWHGPTVARRLDDWRMLLRRQEPDLLIGDHAPAAWLASRGEAYPRAAVGHGYTLPPLAEPMPSLQPWLTLGQDRLAGIDRHFLNVLNPVLAAAGIPELDRVAALFDGVERYLCIEPELDHYAIRPDEAYLGAVEAPPAEAVAPAAPVFVYLAAGNRFLPPLLAALRARGVATVAYIAGLDAPPAEPASSRIRYLNAPADLGPLARDCRLAVIHGGALTASFFLRRGVGVWVCPQDLEKALLGRRLKERGLADSLNWFAPDTARLESELDRILASPPPSGLAAFAARHRALPPETATGHIADAIERQLESGARP